MKRLICSTLLLILLGFANPGEAWGQNGENGENGDGWGGFLDWIHRLSGPPFVGVGGLRYWGVGHNPALQFRVSVALRFSYKPFGFYMATTQATLEAPVGGRGSYGIGAAGHLFVGRGAVFTNYSLIPVIAAVQAGHYDGDVFKIGAALHYFPAFPESAPALFERDSGEWVGNPTFGLEHPRN